MIVSKVKKIMEEKGVTLKQLVQMTGLAEETIMRTRRGGGRKQLASCQLMTLEIIAKALGVKIKDLFDEVDDP